MLIHSNIFSDQVWLLLYDLCDVDLQSNICSLLQVMSLAEGVRTDFSDLLPLVSLRDGDLRQSILQLQLWAKSGGGLDKKDASAKVR